MLFSKCFRDFLPQVFQPNTKLSNETNDDNNTDGSFPWPPAKFKPGSNGLRFFRHIYDLQLSDPTSADTVTVIVGQHDDTATFHFPKDMLKSSSDFFATALAPVWTRTTPRVITLPDILPAHFDLYARWLASGAEILTEEEDWKASFSEYLRWRRELEHDEDYFQVDAKKQLCPGTVWDFSLSTQAWFLGDFLLDSNFQNHCLGHLYYMHLRFDHVWNEGLTCNEEQDGMWHWGTVGYVSLQDVLYTWDKTTHTPTQILLNDHHPLRRFYIYWLTHYWHAYEISSWDDEAVEGINDLAVTCQSVVVQMLHRATLPCESWHGHAIGPLDHFYV